MKVPDWLRFRNLATWRWLLPLAMLLAAATFELVVSPYLGAAGRTAVERAPEIGLYGIIGPVLLALFIHRAHRHQMARHAAEEELRKAYAGLETRVEERTIELQARTRELQTLNAVAAELNRSVDLSQTLDGALEQVLELMGLTAGWVLLLDEDGQFQLTAARDLPPALVEDFQQRAALCDCQRGVLSDELNHAVNILTCQRLREAQGDVGGLTVHASVPLYVEDRWLGIMNLASPDPDPLTAERLGLLTTIGHQVSVAVERAQLYEQLREQADALAQANTELVRALQVKTHFMNRMSHELRTPLNAIIGFASMINSGRAGPLTEKQTRYAENILSSGEHLLALVNDVLDLVEAEAGEMELHPETVPVADLFANVASRMAPRAEKKDIHQEVELHDPELTVRVDLTCLRQILLNLLSNAIKFTPEGGEVSIQCSVIRDQPSVIGDQLADDMPNEYGRLPDTDDWLLITVTDTGVGIKEENFPRVFGAFEQIDSSLTRSQEGTGLGLALTKHLVKLHGGRIWFESEYGEGTTFYVVLPAASDLSDLSFEAVGDKDDAI